MCLKPVSCARRRLLLSLVPECKTACLKKKHKLPGSRFRWNSMKTPSCNKEMLFRQVFLSLRISHSLFNTPYMCLCFWSLTSFLCWHLPHGPTFFMSDYQMSRRFFRNRRGLCTQSDCYCHRESLYHGFPRQHSILLSHTWTPAL